MTWSYLSSGLQYRSSVRYAVHRTATGAPPPASSLRKRRWGCSTCTSWRIPSRRGSRQHRNSIRSRTRRPTSQRRLLRNRVRTLDRFEAVNRDRIGPGTHLQVQKLAGTSQDHERAAVELRLRTERRVLANKNLVCRGQSTRNHSSRRRPVMRRRQHKNSQSRLDPVLEHCRR